MVWELYRRPHIYMSHDVASIPRFHQYVNSNDLNLKFTCGFSQSKVYFLDLTLERNTKAARISTSVLLKPDAVNTILNPRSSHPRHTLEAILVGEYFRLKRACSSESVLESQIKSLNERLYQQGYKKHQCAKMLRTIHSIP